MIEKLFALLFGSLATRTAGAVSSVGTIGALLGAVAWLFGAGREWSVTLNALELSGVVLGGSALLEWARRAPPPGG